MDSESPFKEFTLSSGLLITINVAHIVYFYSAGPEKKAGTNIVTNDGQNEGTILVNESYSSVRSDVHNVYNSRVVKVRRVNP